MQNYSEEQDHVQLECTLIDASTNVTRERGYLLELLLGLALHASQHSISCFLKLDLTQYSVHPYKQPYKNSRNQTITSVQETKKT